jgi:HEAT repeat protein
MRKALPVILLAMLLMGSGCSFFTETNPEPQWSQGRWRSLKSDDTQRLAGEDKRASTVGDYVFAVPRGIWSGISWSWDAITGDRPIKYAKNLFDNNPDLRREAVYVLSDNRWGRNEPYTKYYAHMAAVDTEPTVRTAAIRALNRSRNTVSVPAYISALNDADANVRLEAAKALANIPDPRAATGLMKLLGDEHENRDVRLACADALREYRTSEVAQSLIRVLNGQDFGVAWQARQSLNLMTGQDYRYSQSAWLGYLTGPAKPFG